MNARERLREWVLNLPQDDAVELLVDLVVYGIGQEDISFHSDTLVPYWTHTGDPLIEGQKLYSDD